MTLAQHLASAPSGGSIALVAVGLVAAYVIACTIWPFAACPRCDGTGRFRSPSGKAWRNCRRCQGSGTRIRVGRRAWTALNRSHNRARRHDG